LLKPISILFKKKKKKKKKKKTWFISFVGYLHAIGCE